MSINGIGSAGGFDLSKMASKIASKMVKDLDTNKDGGIDKKEFVAGLTAKGISADEASKQFDDMDAKKTGKISQADIESAIKSGRGGPPPGGRPAGGHAPGGTGHAAGGASTKSYDAKDLNKDGTVSADEELIYDLSHPTKTTTSLQNVGNNVNTTA